MKTYMYIRPKSEVPYEHLKVGGLEYPLINQTIKSIKPCKYNIIQFGQYRSVHVFIF